MTPTDPTSTTIAARAPWTADVARASDARSVGTLVTTWALPGVVALVVFVAFSPALRNGFLRWDDVVLFSDNPRYRGLGWAQIRWMFTSVTMGHWVPLTWLTHGLDYVLWGMNPFGYHLMNIVIHAANAAAFYVAARRLLARATSLSGAVLALGAAGAALFFALHPLRAESVAWVTERRDVLSGFFFLLTILFHLQAIEADGRRRRRLRFASLGCFVLAFLSKGIVMTLPLVLVLLDFYPLGRLDARWRSWRGDAWPVWREKLPYLAISLAGGGVAFIAQSSFFTPVSKVGWTARPLIAFYGLWFYVSKTAVPLELSPLYELPSRFHALDPRFLVPIAGVVGISVAVLALRRRCPAGLALWLYYGIVVGPVSGLLHAGFQLAHDRYSYLSCLGWAMLVGAGVGALLRMRETARLAPRLARIAIATLLLWGVGLATLTWQQVQIWRDTESLWRFAVESEPNCALCRSNLGVFLSNEGHFGLALPHLERALALRPEQAKYRKDMGLTLLNLGSIPEAVGHLGRAVEIAPNDVDALNTFSVALMTVGRHAEALRHLEHAVQLKADDLMVLTNLGTVLMEFGRFDDSVRHLAKAVELDPKAPRPRIALGKAYLRLGRIEAAREQYDVVVTLDSRLAPLLGVALIQEW